MPRILSLGLIALIAGGGWSVYQGMTPSDMGRMAKVATGVLNGQPSNQQPTLYQQPTNSQSYYSQSNGQPNQIAQQQYAIQAAPGYSPTSFAPTIKIASFNIQIFGDSKARKQPVMKLLGEVIRQFDVIAIQEIRTQNDYFIQEFLRNYVNQPGKTLYDARVSRRMGRSSSTEQYAFIFNTATINIHPQVVFEMQDASDALHREPYVAMFQTKLAAPDKAFTFLLMNTHTDPDEVPQELDALYGAYQAVQRMQIGGQAEDDVILLGDFNTAVPAAGPRTPGVSARSLVPKDLHALSRLPGIYPLIKNEATNLAGNRLHDNLLISRLATTEFTGRSGVFDFPGIYGLSKDNAKEVSDHLPVWGEFSALESGVVGRVAQVR